MNYNLVYRNIIAKAKSENRQKNNGIYYEAHHIIPEFMFKNRKRKGPAGDLEGNPNDPDNIILLTAREHFICHILLSKIFKNTKYYYSAASSLAFFTSKVVNKHPRFKDKTKINSKLYEFARVEGLSAISSARKNKIPMKDVETGKIVGSFTTDHENYISGKWVHHSKGRRWTDIERSNHKNKGEDNSNFKKLEYYEQFYVESLKRSEKNGFCFAKVFITEMNLLLKPYNKKISTTFILNKHGNFTNLINYVNSKYKTEFKFDKYYSQRNRDDKNKKS